MNKKPGLLIAVSFLAIIILAVSFNMNFGSVTPVHLRAGVNPDSVLYVCPVGDDSWHQAASSLHFFSKYIYLLFSFAGIVLVFSWGWAFYQNLLKDKFNEDVYKNPWAITKFIFWMAVIFSVIIMTPNHFRRVEVKGHGTDWVLCDNTSKGAKAVIYRNVTLP